MNHAFSAILVMSQYSGMSCARQRSWTAVMFARLIGWPPAMFTVTAMLT